jgi:hypothetical protein
VACAAVVFPGRRLERPEVRAVNLVALHQLNAPRARGDGLDRLQGVDEHPLVGLDQLGEVRPVLVGGVERDRVTSS